MNNESIYNTLVKTFPDKMNGKKNDSTIYLRLVTEQSLYGLLITLLEILI